MNAYLLLALAIGTEVMATLSLRASEGFTRPLPSGLVVLGYGAAFYLMSQALRSLSVSFVYAVWSGAGTALVAVLGVLLFRDRMDWPGVIGIGLVIAGVIVLNTFSQLAGH